MWLSLEAATGGICVMVAMRGYVLGSLMNSTTSVVKTVFIFILMWCALGVSSCMAVGLPAAALCWLLLCCGCKSRAS